jgi:hypothetical protein
MPIGLMTLKSALKETNPRSYAVYWKYDNNCAESGYMAIYTVPHLRLLQIRFVAEGRR